MDKRVGLKVLRVSKNSDEDVLCADVDIERATDTQSDKTDAIRDLLHCRASTAQRG